MGVFAARMATLVPRPLQRLRDSIRQPPRTERNTEQNTRSNISRHYDLSNELFETFLDETLTYSSALFPSSRPVEYGTTVLRDPSHRYPSGRISRTRSAEDRSAARQGRRRCGHPAAGDRTGWGELCIRAAERGAWSAR